MAGKKLMKAPQAPAPPKFQPINIQGTTNQAISADIAGYNWSDQNFLSRFPGLVAGEQQQLSDAYNNLNGPLDPTTQNSFVNQGASQALGNSGSGDPFATLGNKDSGFGSNTVAKSVANNVQSKQDSDRNYFEQLISSSPYAQRQFGPSGSDTLNWLLSNSTGQNAASQQAFAGQVSNRNAQTAANNANTSAAISAAVAILGSILSFSDKKLKENIKQVGTSPSGIPIKQFNYKADPSTRYEGVVAQDVEKKKPSAVINVGGTKLVKHNEIDVAIKRLTRKAA